MSGQHPPFGRIPAWLIDDPSVPILGKYLYAVLTRYGKNVFPSVPTLAGRLGCTDRYVRILIGHLKRVEVLRVHHSPGRPNTYELLDNPGTGVQGNIRCPGTGETETPELQFRLKREERRGPPPSESAAPPNDSTSAPTTAHEKCAGECRRPEEPGRGPLEECAGRLLCESCLINAEARGGPEGQAAAAALLRLVAKAAAARSSSSNGSAPTNPQMGPSGTTNVHPIRPAV